MCGRRADDVQTMCRRHADDTRVRFGARFHLCHRHIILTLSVSCVDDIQMSSSAGMHVICTSSAGMHIIHRCHLHLPELSNFIHISGTTSGTTVTSKISIFGTGNTIGIHGDHGTSLGMMCRQYILSRTTSETTSGTTVTSIINIFETENTTGVHKDCWK